MQLQACRGRQLRSPEMTHVVFVRPAQLYVSPLFRLVSKAGAQLKDIGPPEAVVESIGNFITGGRARGPSAQGSAAPRLQLPGQRCSAHATSCGAAEPSPLTELCALQGRTWIPRT